MLMERFKAHSTKRNSQKSGSSPVAKQSKSEKLEFNLKFTVPKVGLGDRFEMFYLVYKPYVITGMVVFVVAVVVGGFSLFYSGDTKDSELFTPAEQASMLFSPLAPDVSDDEIDYRFDAQRNVLSFSTQYNNATLTVSQQSVPENVESDPEGLAGIAQQIGAEETVESDNGIVYLAPNTSTSGQTALFATDEVLVFIYSDIVLGNEEWQEYINQLRPR